MARHAELAAPEIRIIPPRLEAAADCLTGVMVAALVLPGIGIAGAPIHAGGVSSFFAVLVTVAVALALRRLVARALVTYAVAELAVFCGCFLLNDASYPGSGFVVAALIGAGLGPLLPERRTPRLRWIISALGGLLFLVFIRARSGVGEAALLTSGATFLAVATALTSRRYVLHAPRRTWILTGTTVVYVAFSVFWVGSTAPSVQWFGSLEFHGPRNLNEVAITFDDGPNPPYTLQIAAILEEHDARGTFFEVGKAVAQRSDVTKQLIERGHVVGNHSYNHGAFSYLDPNYPELKQAEDEFRSAVGVCPAIFRPPHGTHTWFMSRVVDDARMTLVNWDVSAKDWVEHDAQKLAQHILERVRPGSVIDLHDGLDGNIGADRSVVVEALPAILDGLKAKGLKPVTVDELLDIPAYLPSCP
jgi:peptidoglycan-N-acetylglucosamine deacetylase